MPYNRLTHQVRDALRGFHDELWYEFLSTLENDRATLWTLSKALRHQRPAYLSSTPEQSVYSAADKVETFADSLEAQFSPNTSFQWWIQKCFGRNQFDILMK